jgi:hypothetical protein
VARHLSAIAHSKSQGDAFFELKLDALPDHEIHKAGAVLPGVAGDSQRGSKISNSLAFRDLFSFEVMPSQALRSNPEESFQEYEGVIRTNTFGLLQKLERRQGDVKTEILELFAAKLMNFLGNPYSVRKLLNSVGGALQFYPTDPQILASNEAVLAGAKPQQKYLRDQLGISPEE